jgi:hypothetical protein
MALFCSLIGGEQNFENSDDGGDKNDDDDENDGVRPYQDSVRRNSHGGMIRRLPDPSQHHDRSRGQEEGSGGRDYQSPNLNEHDYGRGEDTFYSSNSNNRVDSPDCSSSGYQTHINVCPTQKSTSDTTGFQLKQVSEFHTQWIFSS